MIVIESMVINKKIESTTTSKGDRRYSLIFTIDQSFKRIGLLLGTKEQAAKNEIINLIDTSKFYKFYIDPTITINNGIQLGIRQIDDNGKIIFKESNTFNLLGGIFFTLMSIVGLLIVYKFKRRQNCS